MADTVTQTQTISTAKRKKRKHHFGEISTAGNILCNIVIGIFTFLCVYPFVFVVIISFTDEITLARNGYSIFPQKFSLAAYEHVFKIGDQLLRSYLVTITITIIGTILSVIAMSLYAYALYRRDFKYRKFFTFLCFFTMLFNGGLVPFYIICTQFIHLRNTIWAMILPICINAFFIFVLRTFFQTTIPESIIESARIDGAGEFRTFFQIVVPISLPGLATIALFSTLGYWNDWFNALLFIDDAKLTPLQLMLMRIETRMEFIVQNASKMSTGDIDVIASKIPRDTTRMAMVVLATVPIIFAYPFFQQYFVQGLTVGAVKG